MRRGGRAGLLAGALALVATGLAGVTPAPASATVIQQWTFDQRADGFPTTTELARSVESADGWVYYDMDGYVDVRVRLGAVPDEASAAVAHAAFGSLDETGACVTAWEATAPTWDPEADPSQASQEVDLTGGFAPDGTTWNCGVVWLTSSDGLETYDRLEGRDPGYVIADPARPRVHVTKVTGTHVRVHRWQKLHVRLVYRGGGAADVVAVRGHGRDVRVRKVRVRRTLENGNPVWVTVRVRLDAPHPRQLELRVRTHGDWAETSVSTRVRLRPVRH